MSVFLNSNLKVTVFGESHSESIGVVLDKFPAGLKVDFDDLGARMARRKASLSPYSTKRIEPDIVEAQSGIYNGYTTGAAICLMIRNTNVRSADYDNISRAARPSHADYPAHVKYGGFEDYRGGGQFSGRLTAPVVAAGALCAQWIAGRGVSALAHIESIAGISDDFSLSEFPRNLSEISENHKNNLISLKSNFAVCSESKKAEMLRRIEQAAADKSSCGGVVEGLISGLSAGLGGTMAESVESRLSALLYAIPAVKGVEFGRGFGFAESFGRECNDGYGIEDGKVYARTNNNGGILGGITTGENILFSAAFKPVPSISAKQRTVDLAENRETELEIKGRHDVCIVPRAVPVVEAAAAMLAADLLLEK